MGIATVAMNAPPAGAPGTQDEGDTETLRFVTPTSFLRLARAPVPSTASALGDQVRRN